MEKEFKIKKVMFTEKNKYINVNRRIYNPIGLSKALSMYKELVDSGKAFGELEQKISYDINPENTVIKIKDIDYVLKSGKCEIYFKLVLLDTPKIKSLKELDDSVVFSFRPRMLVSPKGDLKILAFDLCSETK
jgi:hypothetical protein